MIAKAPRIKRKDLSPQAKRLLSRFKQVETFAGARKVLSDNIAAVVNGRITVREANIVTRATDEVLKRLKHRYGLA